MHNMPAIFFAVPGVGLRTAGLWPAFLNFGFARNAKSKINRLLTITLDNQFLLTSH